MLQYNRTGKGSQCNQAIMLISNQVSSDYNEIFKEYNWPHKPVRVFTYLIANGKSKEDDMKTIACNNKGILEFHFVKTSREFYLEHVFFIFYFRILRTCEICRRNTRKSFKLYFSNGSAFGDVRKRPSYTLVIRIPGW